MKYKTIGWDFRIDTDLFSFHIEPTEKQGFYAYHQEDRATLYCPNGKLSEDARFQSWLRNVIREILREQAKRTFPQRLQEWAKKTGLHYNKLGIHKTISKWGSYSSLGNLNLSLYLMLMDARYVDYTICHELCHSREMNHSPRFWSLLNTILGCDARLISKEMNSIVKQWYEQGDTRFLLISGK